jgi:hypothetical protein
MHSDWNLMNLNHTTKHMNLPRHISVPIVTSNHYSVLENTHNISEIVSEQTSINPTWPVVEASRRKAHGRRENIYRIPVVKNRYKLSCNSDAFDTPGSNLTGNQEVGKQCKKQTLSKKTKHKVLIIGDSHGRGCASKVKYNLENGFEVQGVIKPGAGLMEITSSVKEEVKHLTKKDVVIVWGGTKDVVRNETTSGLNQLIDFLRKITIQTLFSCVSHIDLIYMQILV